MPVRDSLHPRYSFIHPRVVLHCARAQRIHPQINRVIPRREPREVADDLDLAHLRHVPQIFSLHPTKQRGRVHGRHIQWRKLPSGLPPRGLLEDQPFVLTDVARSLARHTFHRATSSTSTSSLPDRTERSLSATNPTAVSIAVRVVISV